jgi:hypothetical protein
MTHCEERGGECQGGEVKGESDANNFLLRVYSSRRKLLAITV